MIDFGTIVDMELLIEEFSTQDRLNQFDSMLIASPQVECPLEEQFTPGLYIRERFVPAGTLFTTYTWKETHPFRCIIGELLIWESGKGWQLFEAPCKGITKKGTKRVVYAITDVIWETLHANPTNTKDPKLLHDMLFKSYDNPYVDEAKLLEINKVRERKGIDPSTLSKNKVI